MLQIQLCPESYESEDLPLTSMSTPFLSTNGSHCRACHTFLEWPMTPLLLPILLLHSPCLCFLTSFCLPHWPQKHRTTDCSCALSFGPVQSYFSVPIEALSFLVSGLSSLLLPTLLSFLSSCHSLARSFSKGRTIAFVLWIIFLDLLHNKLEEVL